MHRVDQDSSFAKALLSESYKTPQVILALSKAATTLSETVLEPIIKKLTEETPLTDEEEEVIQFLAKEHSAEGLQYGGALSSTPKAELLSSNAGKLLLVTEVSQRLTDEYLDQIDSSDKLVGTVKAITDCSFCYVEHLKSLHSQQFGAIKENITPTKQELDIRVNRSEVGIEPHVAITYGIGTQPGVDVAPKDPRPEGTERVHNTGKSTFIGAGTLLKIDALIKNFNDLKGEPETNAGKLKETLAKLAFYGVKYHGETDKFIMPPTVPKPFIEQLAEMGGDGPRDPLPMIATASGTTARTLIALQDLEVFSTEDEFNFDFELAQTISSTLCGSIVHGGHHSVLEVGEIYNRLIDYNAIAHLERTHDGVDETRLPYYEIGDSYSLVPPSMRDDVQEEHAKIMREKFKSHKEIMMDMKKEESPPPPTLSTQDNDKTLGV